MRNAASLASGTDTQTEGTDGLKDRETAIHQSQNWKNNRQSVGKGKPPNQTETTWTWGIHIKTAHQSVNGHKRTLEKHE